MPEPDPVPEPKPGLRWLKAFWLVTCFVVVALLIASHITLISLWASRALDKHIFSISKVNSMTQFMTIATQAWVTLLLVVLSFAVQRIAADRIIRRGECCCWHTNIILTQRQLTPAFRSNSCRIAGQIGLMEGFWRIIDVHLAGKTPGFSSSSQNPHRHCILCGGFRSADFDSIRRHCQHSEHNRNDPTKCDDDARKHHSSRYFQAHLDAGSQYEGDHNINAFPLEPASLWHQHSNGSQWLVSSPRSYQLPRVLKLFHPTPSQRLL